MHRYIISLFVATLGIAGAASTLASGSETATQPQPSNLPTFYSQQYRPASLSPRVVLVEEPYNCGKALFSGKYNFGKPKLTALNIEEKRQRLAALRTSLPSREQNNLNPTELSKRLNNREMNALEYYVRVRFKKYLTNSPTWSKEEPPVKVASSG